MGGGNFTKVPNEVLDNVWNVSAAAQAVLLACLRRDYSQGTKPVKIGLRELARVGRVSKSTATRGIAELEAKGLITVSRMANHASEFHLGPLHEKVAEYQENPKPVEAEEEYTEEELLAIVALRRQERERLAYA